MLKEWSVFYWYQYAEKLFVRKSKDKQHPHSVAQQIWEGVRANDKKAVYRYIVNCEADVNAVYEQSLGSSLTLAKVMLLQEHANVSNSCYVAGDSLDRSSSSSFSLVATSEGQTMDDLDGCTLLHLACETADIGMLELLLQYGANINAADSRGQMPLHRCILKGKAAIAKLLITRSFWDPWFLMVAFAFFFIAVYMHKRCCFNMVLFACCVS